MGGKSSKPEVLSRSLSFRKSQKNSLQKVQRKLDKVSKDIHKFSGSVDDVKYADIKKAIAQIIDELEKISSVVKDKHKDLYQDILERCNHQLQRLDMKVTHASRPTSATSSPPPASSPIPSPIASPISLPPSSPLPSPPLSPFSVDSPMSERSVQLKLVQVTLESMNELQQQKNRRREQVGTSSDEEHDPQREAVNSIDNMRRKIESLEEQIHQYKANQDENLYEQIRTALNQIIIKLDNMETYGNVQIKYERKLALQRAQECMKYLNDDTKPRNLQTQVIVEMHQTTSPSPTHGNIEARIKPEAYVRPITLDLNANDSLKEELRQVIHKRIEEATMDDVSDVDSSEAKGNVTKEPKESFDNTESEDDYDFVNVESEGNSKPAPVLVTSL